MFYWNNLFLLYLIIIYKLFKFINCIKCPCIKNRWCHFEDLVLVTKKFLCCLVAYATLSSYKRFWKYVNKSPTFDKFHSTVPASSKVWYLLVNNIGNFSWSSSPNPFSMYLDNIRSTNSLSFACTAPLLLANLQSCCCGLVVLSGQVKNFKMSRQLLMKPRLVYAVHYAVGGSIATGKTAGNSYIPNKKRMERTSPIRGWPALFADRRYLPAY